MPTVVDGLELNAFIYSEFLLVLKFFAILLAFFTNFLPIFTDYSKNWVDVLLRKLGDRVEQKLLPTIQILTRF